MFFDPARFARKDTPFRDPAQRFSAGRLGMRLFLLSLGVLFTASLVGYVAVRVMATDWPPRDMPGLPPLLLASTAVILASSASVQWGLTGIRRGDRRRLRLGMIITCALGLAFLILQCANWLILFQSHMDLDRHLYAFTFYMLTGLHALHVLGGLIPMSIVAGAALRGEYTAARHEAVHYLAMYWHFLGAVWVALYAALLIGS
jgi:heme/copper-type cytochrome/quinol oxidase subunit 3